MEDAQVSSEDALIAGVAELRERFPRTQELYREVCILLFFRHGITPTANKLYQLVRKGSMSAPSEALSHFWETLRERSRVSVEHADLPDELRTAAGEMVATVWKSAQAMARDSIAQIRQEISAVADSARNAEALAKAAEADAIKELGRTRDVLWQAEALIGKLRQDLAAADATNTGTETRLADVRQLLAQTQAALERARDEQASEREKLSARNQLAEQRFADMEKRALVEIDRERVAAAKLQKQLDHERSEHAKLVDRLRSEFSAVQADAGRLREQAGVLQHSTATLKEDRERAIEQLQQTRAQLEGTIRQAATEAARAEHLDLELHRLLSLAAEQRGAPKVSAPEGTSATIRRTKGVSKTDDRR